MYISFTNEYFDFEMEKQFFMGAGGIAEAIFTFSWVSQIPSRWEDFQMYPGGNKLHDWHVEWVNWNPNQRINPEGKYQIVLALRKKQPLMF